MKARKIQAWCSLPRPELTVQSPKRLEARKIEDSSSSRCLNKGSYLKSKPSVRRDSKRRARLALLSEEPWCRNLRRRSTSRWSSASRRNFEVLNEKYQVFNSSIQKSVIQILQPQQTQNFCFQVSRCLWLVKTFEKTHRCHDSRPNEVRE